jgi:hypothetical protein
MYSRIVLTQAAQHALNPKSITIQYIASDTRFGHVRSAPMKPRHINKSDNVIFKDRMPPSESMTGPRKILPAAMESVDSANRLEITSSRDNFVL